MREKLKNKKHITIIIIFAIGICIACILGIFRPGIHFLSGFMYADVRKNCYLYNVREEKISGKAEVAMKGWRNGITKRFYGTVSVTGYEGTGAGNLDNVSAVNENFSDKEYQNSEMKHRHWVYIDTKNNNKFVVNLSGVASSNVYAICANTEGEAKDRFTKFWNNK